MADGKKPQIIHMTTVPESLIFLRGLPQYLTDNGFDVRVLSSPGPTLDAFGASEDVPVQGVPMARSISPHRDMVSIVRLLRTFRRLKPDMIHAHTPKGGLLGMVSAWLTRVPLRIYQIHGFPHMTARGPVRTLLRWSDRIAALFANQVVCVSESIREIAMQDRISSADKIVVFGRGSFGGVDALGMFNPARYSLEDRVSRRAGLGIGEADPVIGYVGRLAKDKGISELAEAWQRVRAHFPNAHMVLVGIEDARDPVNERTLQMLRSDERVHFTGNVENPANAYALMDVVILPSHREGFGNVLIEAASMGLPSVATRIPGCIDAVVDGVTGTLVPSRDAEALQTALERYLDDPELRRTHGTAGRERVVQDFLQEDVWKTIYQEYCRLLKERGLPVPGCPEKSSNQPVG